MSGGAQGYSKKFGDGGPESRQSAQRSQTLTPLVGVRDLVSADSGTTDKLVAEELQRFNREGDRSGKSSFRQHKGSR